MSEGNIDGIRQVRN